jgi:hypothetical protein
MRALLTFIAIIYLGGIGVELSSKIQATWNNASTLALIVVVSRELPHAAAWPARAFQSATNRH